MTDVKLYVDGLIEKYVSMSAPEYVRLQLVMSSNTDWSGVSREDYNAIMDLIIGQVLYQYTNGIYEMKDLEELKEDIETKREMMEGMSKAGMQVIVDVFKQLDKLVELTEELEK